MFSEGGRGVTEVPGGARCCGSRLFPSNLQEFSLKIEILVSLAGRGRGGGNGWGFVIVIIDFLSGNIITSLAPPPHSALHGKIEDIDKLLANWCLQNFPAK